MKPSVVKKYKVTFNSKSGSAVKAMTITANSILTKPVSPTRKGYKFVGWYKDKQFNKVWNFKTAKVTANTILYAKWQKK